MIQAIIFDCFGVLVGRGFSETYQLAGGDPLRDEQFIDDILGQANLGTITLEEMRKQITARLRIDNDTWDAAVRRSEQPNQQLLDYVSQLSSKYKTAILSNANVGTVQRVLSREQLELFDVTVVSAEVGMIKPQPEIYHYVADKLGVKPSECVFTDDIPSYIEAAKAVGMEGVLYKDFRQFKLEFEAVLSH